MLYKNIDPPFVKDPTTGLYITILGDEDAAELEKQLKEEKFEFYKYKGPK